MLLALFAMLVRLTLTCITLALRIALALSALVGRLLGFLIVGIWRAWRNRQTTKIPLRSEHVELKSPAPTLLAPPPPNPTAFVPRPLRPRPRR